MRRRQWSLGLGILPLLLTLIDFTITYASQLHPSDDSFLDDLTPLPHALDVTIFHNDRQILLELEKNPYLDSGVPGVALRNGGDGEPIFTKGGKTIQSYQDVVNGAAVTLACSGTGRDCRPELVGSYFAENVLHHVEPTPGSHRRRRGARGGIPSHQVYRRPHPSTDLVHIQPEPVSIEIRPAHRKRRRRRQAKPDNIVEILLVLDYKIYKRFYDSVPVAARSRDEIYNKLKQYYFQVFNGMDVRYQLINAPDFSLRIRLSNFIIAEEKRYSPWTESFVRNGTVDVTEVLKPFAETKEEIQRKYNLSPFDHAMAMSGYDLIFENKKTTLGYAYLNTTCQYWSVSFVEDRNDIMKTIWTAAHELGHSLCSLHDGYQNSCLSQRKYIMTSTIDKPSQLTSQNPWKFSSCSVQYFREMLHKLDKQPMNCLRDTSPPNFFGKSEWLSHTGTHFGTLYSPDEQCQRIHGDRSYMCRTKVTDPGLICTNLWCHRVDPDTGESDCTPHLSAAGTTCGYKMWCQRGQCVFNQAAPKMGPCPFGDQPDIRGLGPSCPTRVRRQPTMCHLPEFARQCCQSCHNDTDIGVRINRGTATNTVADNVMAPREINQTPSLSAPSISAGPRRSPESTLDINRVTLTSSDPSLPQAPPAVQPQPDPELPPTVIPRSTSIATPPRPATGGCRDTGSPFNQSVVGCRGFHTFCYLTKVRRDCCATCSRRTNASPVRVMLPVDRSRRKRGQTYYYPVWRQRAYVVRYKRDLARITRRSPASGRFTDIHQAGPHGEPSSDKVSDVAEEATTKTSTLSPNNRSVLTTTALHNTATHKHTMATPQRPEPGPTISTPDPGPTGAGQGLDTTTASDDPQVGQTSGAALVTPTAVSPPAVTNGVEYEIPEYENEQPNENVKEQTSPSGSEQSHPGIKKQSPPRGNEQPHPGTNGPHSSNNDQSYPGTNVQQPSNNEQSHPGTIEQSLPSTNGPLHPGTNKQSHLSQSEQSQPDANERGDIMLSSIDTPINVGLFTNPLREPPAAV